MQQLIPVSILQYLVILLILSNIALAIWLGRTVSHYQQLIKTADKKNLKNILESIQKTLSHYEQKFKSNENSINQIQKNAVSHIQEISLKRFNPFSDTGGDQSFILSILDGSKNGIVLTSLHSRESTRFYVKSVEGGEGKDHPLSIEEQKVVKKRKR